MVQRHLRWPCCSFANLTSEKSWSATYRREKAIAFKESSTLITALRTPFWSLLEPILSRSWERSSFPRPLDHRQPRVTADLIFKRDTLSSFLVVSCPFERHLPIFFLFEVCTLKWLFMCISTVLSNPCQTCHLIWLRVSCCESRLPAYAVPDLDLEIKGGGREIRSKGRHLYSQGTKLLALAITSGGQRRLFVNVIVIFNATLD